MEKPEWLTFADFAGLVGDTFIVSVGDGVELVTELIEANESQEPGGRGPDGQERRQFSLVFRTPPGDVLAQGIRHLTHPGLGELDLFLVPIATGADGVRYEAAFA